MKFIDKRTNEIKTAYSVTVNDKTVYIKFNENGKEYTYNSDNVEIIDEMCTNAMSGDVHKIYRFQQLCYSCKKNTWVYTYIVYDDESNEDVTFPWDKERLLQNQDILAHMQDPDIEYYGLKILGDDEELDELLLEKFPDRIKMQYSKTQRRSYPMNLCEHCKAKQGEHFIYRRINEKIKNMEKIEVCGE